MDSQNNTEYQEKIGENLRIIRKRLKLTLENVEQIGCINWRQLQRIETGHHDIRVSTVIKLAIAYNVSVNEIFDGIP